MQLALLRNFVFATTGVIKYNLTVWLPLLLHDMTWVHSSAG